MEVYSADVVKLCKRLYRNAPVAGFKTTWEVIQAHGEILLDAFRNQDPASVAQLNNWHPDLANIKAPELFEKPIKLDDALLTISREFGYESLHDARHGAQEINQDFEMAVDFALAGDLDGLGHLLKQNPELINQRSSFGHGATLLIYMGSNGLEMWRQVVPANICKIVQFLVDQGGDICAKIKVYGGNFGLRTLAASSAHPIDAGIADELLALIESIEKKIGN